MLIVIRLTAVIQTYRWCPAHFVFHGKYMYRSSKTALSTIRSWRLSPQAMRTSGGQWRTCQLSHIQQQLGRLPWASLLLMGLKLKECPKVDSKRNRMDQAGLGPVSLSNRPWLEGGAGTYQLMFRCLVWRLLCRKD